MGRYLDSNGNFCYMKSGAPLSDTHGGRSEIHRREQEEVINEIVDRKLNLAMEAIETSMIQIVNTYAAEVWSNLISSLKGALNTDVIAEVEIAFENANEIFHSKKAQEYVAKNIYKALDKELGKIKNMKLSI